MNKGQFNSKQIVSCNWIHEAKKSYKQFESEEDRTTGYGYQLWTCEITSHNTQIEYYYAKLSIMAVAKSHLQNDKSSAPRRFFEELLYSWMGELNI